MKENISVLPADAEHYESIIDYFLNADAGFLNRMGVDPQKLPARDQWLKMLRENHALPTEQKSIFYVIWYLNGEAIGHSNINKIIFGKEAYMHLHMWSSVSRKSGFGLRFVQKSIPYYFKLFQLIDLFCEPYALNPAPNKTLPKAGFQLLKHYETIPGTISFHQPVNRWHLPRERFMQLFS
jgi:[ribosomal protein S5]-alanine N-acetyltransferase